MSDVDKVRQLEGRLQEFKNNQKHAEMSGELKKAKSFEGQINDLELKIAAMKRNLNFDSVYDILEQMIMANSSRLEAEEKFTATLNNRITELEGILDKLLHPEKYIEIKEPEPEPIKEEPLMTCPKCGRGGFRGKTGLAAHQRWCKARQ